MFRLPIQLALIFFSLEVFAGGWVGGGSELLRDARNPWFLPNVKTILYCVQHDEKNFGASLAQAEKQIEQAFAYWKREFQYALMGSLKNFGPMHIAQQELRKVDCSAETDIVFQFGVLTPEQSAFLVKPKDYVAVSVRTSYSAHDMRGRGFIYVSPVRGPLAYDSGINQENAWQKADSGLLRLTLMHELGHVFGLPHIGRYGSLMAEGFAESILTLGADPVAIARGHENFFSLGDAPRGYCLDSVLAKRFKKVFELDPSWNCLHFELKHAEISQQIVAPSKITIYAGPSLARASLVELGTADLMVTRFFPIFMQPIWLPDGQKLFAPEEIILNYDRRAILGVQLLSTTKKGTFQSKRGKMKREIIVHFEQGGLRETIDVVSPEGGLDILH